ncbi:MAG: chorismate synthase [Desulfovibrionaceae bacterium]
MNGNTFGTLFQITTFGESHGKALGGIINGCPAHLIVSQKEIQKALDARRPGPDKGIVSSSRKENDIIEIFSGTIYDSERQEHCTTGTPIAFCVYNTDSRPKDYDATIYRPSHADYVYDAKYGIRDHRGGGRASGRETLSRVIAGVFAQKILDIYGIKIYTGTLSLGGIEAQNYSLQTSSENLFYAVDKDIIPLWEKKVQEARLVGDSLGGIVVVEAHNMPVGLGEPIFDKLDARIAYAMMSIGTVKGVEIGSGFSCASMYGSEHNDPIYLDNNQIRTSTNNAGGIVGGISTGENICVRLAVKPISSISLPQQTITKEGKACAVTLKGRHDCSAIPRIIPVVQAMLSITLADYILLQQKNTSNNNFLFT